MYESYIGAQEPAWNARQITFLATHRNRRPKAKTPDACWRRGFSNNSLTMTYFHTGCSTIIGAKSFHGPVRDGKGWDQLAMVIRHDLSVVCRAAGSSPGTRHIQPKGEEAATSSPAVCRKAMQRSMSCLAGCEYRNVTHHTAPLRTIKVIGTSRTGN